MTLQKVYAYIVATILFLALIIAGIKVLHHEWRAGYTMMFQQTYHKVNLLELQLKTAFEQFYRPVLESTEKGLAQRHLYISEKSKNRLMEDMPSNLKKWQKAHMIYPDGQPQKIKVRLNGDNPTNWAFHRKSWRVKLKKNRLINNSRVFNYTLPQEEEWKNYLPNYLAKRAGVLAPKVNLVELYINDKSQGIYHELEKIDESFLRNRKIMPVNIYKGEWVNRDRKVIIGLDLFNNPASWSKVAVLGLARESDSSDLEYFLELVKLSETSESSFARLKRLARYEDWARFAAFQTLVQSSHNSSLANMRLVSDPWKGTIRPIIHDIKSFLSLQLQPPENNSFEIQLDLSSQPLLSLYNRSSDFIAEKYKILYKFSKDRLILEASEHLQKILPDLSKSFSRNHFRYEKIYRNQYLVEPIVLQHNLKTMGTVDGMEEEWIRRCNMLQWYEKALQEKLEQIPTAHWLNENGFISLVVSGPIPINRVTLEFPKNGPLPRSIAWDKDGDRHFSEGDIQIPFSGRENKLQLDAIWITNRVHPSPEVAKVLALDAQGSLKPAPTQFRLVMDKKISPIAIRAESFLTKDQFLVPKGKRSGQTPIRWNTPVLKEKVATMKVWPKSLTIEGVHLVDQPVKILPGTTIKMKPGASLIFRNQVQIDGKKEAPVTITSVSSERFWGTIALHGPKTAGSILSHLTVENGSGALIDNILYSGMFSIHEAKNIKIENLKLRKNNKFDDMMHVVYSENIVLQNCTLEKSLSDAIDVDISTIRIEKCKISTSGNDAIDLMSSKALINKSDLSGSGDKGISIGEASDVVIFNSKIYNNVIGIESKDNSTAYVINSTLIDNKRQINAYKKNWRYEKGGSIVVDKSIISSADYSIKGDNNSKISIYNSSVFPKFSNKEPQVEVGSVSGDNGNDNPILSSYQTNAEKALGAWGITSSTEQRGIFE